MKKSLFFSAVALCALTIFGCNKEVDSPKTAPEGREVHFTINAGAPETKTFIEYDGVNHKYVPNWQNSDKLGVIFNSFGESKKAADAEFSNTLASGTTASFSGTGTVKGDEQTLYAFYPASAFGKAYSNSVIGLEIPDTQKPTAASFDPSADVLVNEPYSMVIANADVVIDDMQFRRVGSILRLTITDGTSTGKISSDKIKTVTISSNMANAAFAGRYRYDFVGKKAYYNNGTVNEHMATKIASVTADLTDNPLSVGDPIFLVVNPQDLTASSKLTVEIATDNHNITKEITLTQVLPFRGGTMTSISVGIKDEDSVTDALQSKTYVLVKDVAELTVGSEVIIADYGDANAVMSTNQQTNNRAAVTVEKSNDKQSITTDNVNVQVFTIAAGNKANTIAFYDGEGYLYAASSGSNHLKTENELSDNSSWNVTIDGGTGEATVLAQGNYTRNKMRFNPNNGTPIFACYASGSTTGTAVSIYKLDDNRTPSGLAWDDDEGLGDMMDIGNTILPNLVNPNGVAPITYSSSDPTVATVLENEHTVTLLNAGTTQIHAIFAGDATYKAADVYYTLTVEDNRPAVTLSFATASYALVVGSAEYTSFAGQAVTATPSVSGIVYAMSGDAIGTINASTGVVTLDGTTPGTATVTASFAGNATYKASDPASYTITVSSSSYDFETVAELNDLVTTTSTTYHGYLTNAVVSFVPATNTAIIKDATGSVMYYKSGHGLKQGQTYTGAISVTAIKYNGLYSEITAITNAAFAGDETVIAPESVALSALIGHFSEYQNAYVQVPNLTVVSIDSKNVNVTDGVNSYVVYYNPGSATCSAGDVITAVGTVTKYQTTEEIKVWKAADITVTASAPKAVTFTQPSGAAGDAGCSFTVSVGGSPITSGDTVASGTTVTLNATAGTDYEFTGWTVTGATVADASSATTTFVMGTSAVTISASFTSTGGGGNPTTTTYTFTSKSWADESNSWTSGKDGNQLTSGRGVQVTTGASGANATTKSSLTGVTNIVVTYSTNASNGAGSIAVKIGDNDAHSQNVTKTGGTTDRTLTYTIDPAESGNVTLTVTCTTNSIYVKSIAITHN